MSNGRDQARLIAERVARCVAEGGTVPAPATGQGSPVNGASVEDLAAIRTALHDLERKLERVESKLTGGAPEKAEPPGARFKDFVTSSPPAVTRPSIASEPAAPPPGLPAITPFSAEEPQSAIRNPQSARPQSAGPLSFTPPTQSPWLSSFSSMMTSPSNPIERPLGAEENPQSGIRNPQALHSSQERFDVPEATVAELVDFFESEKKCALEPGKACDHCDMCSSRGF